MFKTAIAAALMALAGTAGAQTVIFDTFNEDDPATLFDCCNYIALDSAQSGTLAIAAIPFTAQADGKITEVDVALAAVNDPFNSGVEIQVMNGNFLPDQRKQRFYQSDLPALGQCCAYFSEVPGKGVKVKAGQTYWIMVKSLGAQNGWNLNSMGLSGPYAVKIGAARNWSMTSGPLPAVRVITQ